jgi:hypothetical protein
VVLDFSRAFSFLRRHVPAHRFTLALVTPDERLADGTSSYRARFID